MNEEELQKHSGIPSAFSHLLSTLSCHLIYKNILHFHSLVHRPFIFLPKEIPVPAFISFKSSFSLPYLFHFPFSSHFPPFSSSHQKKRTFKAKGQSQTTYNMGDLRRCQAQTLTPITGQSKHSWKCY